MPTHYMGPTDAAKLAWMLTFAAGITASPATYGLTAGDATTIDTAVDAYDAAFALGGTTNGERNNPATFTVETVAAKDLARNNAMAVIAPYYNAIRVNTAVTDPDKIAIGVRPLNPGPHGGVFVPDEAPLINVLGATPGVHTLVYAPISSPTSRAKPVGAAAMQLFVVVGVEEVLVPTGAVFQGVHTTTPVAVAWDPADDGKVATYFARWMGKRGDVGPWSSPVSMRIAF